jgi:hypothetical protein
MHACQCGPLVYQKPVYGPRPKLQSVEAFCLLIRRFGVGSGWLLVATLIATVSLAAAAVAGCVRLAALFADAYRAKISRPNHHHGSSGPPCCCACQVSLTTPRAMTMPEEGGDRRPVQQPCSGRSEKAGRLCKPGLQPKMDLEHWDSIAIRHLKVSHAADLVPRGGHVRPRHIVLAHRRPDGLGAPNRGRARSPRRHTPQGPRAERVRALLGAMVWKRT